MTTFVNIMDLVYPVGSLYMSIAPTSPASIFVGEWSQIKNALIAATGFGGNTSGKYSGNNTMTINQKPWIFKALMLIAALAGLCCLEQQERKELLMQLQWGVANLFILTITPQTSGPVLHKVIEDTQERVSSILISRYRFFI